MSDDKKLSLLITQSLRSDLSAEDSQRLSEHLEMNEEAAKFVELSKLIQESVAGLSLIHI